MVPAKLTRIRLRLPKIDLEHGPVHLLRFRAHGGEFSPQLGAHGLEFAASFLEAAVDPVVEVVEPVVGPGVFHGLHSGTLTGQM